MKAHAADAGVVTMGGGCGVVWGVIFHTTCQALMYYNLIEV